MSTSCIFPKNFHLYMYVCTHVYVYVYLYIVQMLVYANVHACTFMPMHTCAHAGNMRIDAEVSMYICTCTCIHGALRGGEFLEFSDAL